MCFFFSFSSYCYAKIYFPPVVRLLFDYSFFSPQLEGLRRRWCRRRRRRREGYGAMKVWLNELIVTCHHNIHLHLLIIRVMNSSHYGFKTHPTRLSSACCRESLFGCDSLKGKCNAVKVKREKKEASER